MAEIQTQYPCNLNNETIYLTPDSAEGKALQRILYPIPEDEWVTVDTEHFPFPVTTVVKNTSASQAGTQTNQGTEVGQHATNG